tara:strand:- start:6449 stop:6601 length:153 start_codon:yes stop_codon:yes gene_type:complete
MEGEEAVGGVLSVDTTVEVTVLVSAAYPTVVKQNTRSSIYKIFRIASPYL